MPVSIFGDEIALDLRSRSRETSEIAEESVTLQSERIGIVIVDMWNWHWCMTAAHRVDAMVPRMNMVLRGARALGMQVIWTPTDVAGQYVGTDPRERAIATPKVKVAAKSGIHCRFTAPQSPHQCGPGIRCGHNYGWDAMHPELEIDNRHDYIASDRDEMVAICHQHKLTHLIYMGVHTDRCVVGKPPAMTNMASAGLSCLIARDLTDAVGGYEPGEMTPDDCTEIAVADLERTGVASLNMADLMRKCSQWDERVATEPVRFTPWGKADRPYQFEKSCIVTLTCPLLKEVSLRYTLDGTEPGPQSQLYTEPVCLDESTILRAAAFRVEKMVSLPSRADYVRLPPVPPKPDVYLDQLEPLVNEYASAGRTTYACFWDPKENAAYSDERMKTAGVVYHRGLGMRANSGARYDLNDTFDRFVARVGIDDNVIDKNAKHMLARYPSVRFRVIVDGKVLAESPVMRVQQQPWNFDVQIPAGSRQIHLVLRDAGTVSEWDLGNWIDAGFMLHKPKATPRQSDSSNAQ